MYCLYNKYLVEHLYIQVYVRCFVSKECKGALTYMFMNHLFDTINNLSFGILLECALHFRVYLARA